MNSETIDKRYVGATASNYESKRLGSKKWENEQHAVELLLSKARLSYDIRTLLDIPVGTGRFIPLYQELPIMATGMDVSDDMLSEADKKVSKDADNIILRKGNVLDESTIDAEPDIVVCIRLLNWFKMNHVEIALQNMIRTNTSFIIVGIRTKREARMGFLRRAWVKAGQIGLSIKNMEISSSDGIEIHTEKDWTAMIDKYNLSIENKILIDVGLFGKKYGTEYYIYLMKCG